MGIVKYIEIKWSGAIFSHIVPAKAGIQYSVFHKRCHGTCKAAVAAVLDGTP
jgi:hypothetical protein